MTPRHILGLLLGAWLLACAPAASAQDFPALTGRVVDAADIIPATQEEALVHKLEKLEQDTGRQFVVATVTGLQGYDIADYGYRLGRFWGIGDAERNDGVILLVAPVERKVRIEVGYGLEGILTDAFAGRIIEQDIIPSFKAGDMPGGIEKGANAIAVQLGLPEEEALARAAAVKNDDIRLATRLVVMLVLLFFLPWMLFVVPIVIFAKFAPKHYKKWKSQQKKGKGSRVGRILVSSGSSSRGYSGGSSFSGGGGSFGGGGSSGSW